MAAPRSFLIILVLQCCSLLVWVATPGDFEHMPLFVIFVGGSPRPFLNLLVFLRCRSLLVWVATPGDFENLS